jgi:hypothetical protein
MEREIAGITPTLRVLGSAITAGTYVSVERESNE